MANKKLNQQTISKVSTKFNERISLTVTDRFSDSYTIEINKYFKKTEIQKMIVDYFSFKEELKTIVFDLELVRNTAFLFPALLVKYFSNVPLSDDIVELISGTETLMDIEVFDHIVGALPQEEVERVNSMIKTMTDNIPLMNKMLGNENINEISNEEQYIGTEVEE